MINLTKRSEYRNLILIPFSGGFDSTTILINECERITKLNLFKNEAIILYYFDDTILNKEKKKLELESAKNTLELIRKRFPKVQIDFNLITFRLSFDINPNKDKPGNLISPQSNAWCGLLNRILSTFINVDYIEVLIGLNYNDNGYHSAVLMKTQLEEWYEKTHIINGNKLNVAFPLLYVKKSEILVNLITNYPEIFKSIWYCENPNDGKPCGVCNKCLELFTGLLYGYNTISDQKTNVYDKTQEMIRCFKPVDK